MFKKIFGPKKFEAQGTAVPLEDLRNVLLTYFPKQGELNQHLRFEKTDKVGEGFEAIWEFYANDTDTDGKRQRVLVKHTIFADIRPGEKAVFFKTRHFSKTKRPPKGEPVYNFWQTQVRIGKLDVLLQEKPSKFVFYNAKKVLQPLVEDAAAHGWDAYQ